MLQVHNFVDGDWQHIFKIGDNNNDSDELAVSVSFNGSHIALSLIFDEARSDGCVYERHLWFNWDIGVIISKTYPSDYSVYTVVLSAGGTHIAIGSPLHESGNVRVLC